MTLYVPRANQAMSTQEQQWYRKPDPGNTIRMPRTREVPGLSAIQESTAEAEETQGHRSRLGVLPSIQSQINDGLEYI